MAETKSDQNMSTVFIEDELKKSYIDYAMSVIIGRALPDVRDGLKPVHRRILYAMRELGNFYNRPYLKSARIVGDVIGKYHPHGDTAVYDAVVRMAQDFSLRYPLVDGQGNFGSLDGDSPAAMRYTEVRMTRLVQEILQDLEKETVDFAPTYDNTLVEPLVLPSRLPNLLMNGSSGIAVGMATNIPPHNLTELVNGLIALIDDPSISIHRLMEEYITGPDFPTGAFIAGRAGIREAYETGRGSILMRSKIDVEVQKNGCEHLIVKEIPFQQNKSQLVEKIALLVKDKKITGISDVRDESDRHGVRIVIELKKDEITEVLTNQLFKMTPLQKSFGINLLAIVNNKPELLNLKQILQQFLYHRRSVVYRRSVYDLKKAEEHLHILAGLKIALENIDAIITLIKTSPTPNEARGSLIGNFGLSEKQAQTILEMRLQRLTALEQEKILADFEETSKKIMWLKEVISSDSRIMDIIQEELLAIKEIYGDERKTKIIAAPDEILPEDLITPEEMVVTITHAGYIKRSPVALYRTQRRGGKGVRATQTIENDFVSTIHLASTLDTFLFFTSYGKVFWRKVFQLPQASRTSRGKSIVNLLELEQGERVAAILPVTSLDQCSDEDSILMVTMMGVVKKTPLREFQRPLRKGKKALTFRDDDEIICADVTNGNSEVLLLTSLGMSIRFHEGDVRQMGRIAAGVRGISLDEGDSIVGAVVIKNTDSSILTVTEQGYGKRSLLSDYRLQKRGGKGIFAIRANKRNGHVVGAIEVDNDDEVMLITNSGKTIRMAMDSVRVIGRNTQGVRLINLEAPDTVVGLALCAPAEQDESDKYGSDEDHDV